MSLMRPARARIPFGWYGQRVCSRHQGEKYGKNDEQLGHLPTSKPPHHDERALALSYHPVEISGLIAAITDEVEKEKDSQMHKV